MKNYILKRLPVIAFLLAGVLLSAFISGAFAARIPQEKPLPESNESAETITLCRKDGIYNVPLYDYVCSVLCAEILPSAEPETIKAFAVAVYSGALYKKSIESESLRALHSGADLCDDPHHCQGYITYDEGVLKWGKETCEEFFGRVRECVSEVFGICALYGGKPINAAYFVSSCGRTENAEEVFGSYVPYLIGVDSSFESEMPEFYAEKEIPLREFKRKLQNASADFCPDEIAEGAEFPVKYTGAGAVAEITIGGAAFSGRDIRDIFGLRSTAFSVRIDESKAVFSQKGYGHLVGMSYYGAEYMAKNGKDYKDILCWYYSGIELSNI